jgi:predicted dehydrogenase/threonine dehydrogenase-like Zn-dependent dehydrogenase
VKQVLIRGGGVVVEDVPAPKVDARGLLVRAEYSCISVGTELSSVAMSGLPLYRRALRQPEHAKRVLEIARDEGFHRTVKRVRGMLQAGVPAGYSTAGVVLEVGSEVEGFAPGDRVACAGAGFANHAEIVSVPVNLAVRIPDGVTTPDAATVTLGAIALQGMRRVEPTLGETVVVLGLGILGQLASQLLRAGGCRVIGVDVDPGRVTLAQACGAPHGIVSTTEDVVERTHALTDGFGADAVLITATTSDSDAVSEAFRCCRKKGRVVLVGDVGLDLRRGDMYEKELDFRISTSYGPGRYDPVYELGGHDYPIGYVRWTENRNMWEYLRQLATGAVRLAELAPRTYPVDAAPDAYAALRRDTERPLLALLSYPEREEARATKVRLRAVPPSTGRIGVALVGAGSFAQGTHVPNLLRLRDRFELRAVVSRTGSTAKAVADRAEAAYATTEVEDALADDAVALVLVSTRHDSHAELALRALRAGKHVFVEKPLALTERELVEIEGFYGEQPDGPLLVTGFNRRFSPAARRMRELLANRATPLVADYRMNAGFLPRDHWVHGPEGGGRNVGEACHVYDLFVFLTGSTVTDEVAAVGIGAGAPRLGASDNFSAVVRFDEGSVCTLTYTALGVREYPKERLDVFADRMVLSLDDYRSLAVAGRRAAGWKAATQQKGHREELEALASALAEGGPWPITLEEQLAATRISFAVERALHGGVGSSSTRNRKGEP